MSEITGQVIIRVDAGASLVAHMRAHKPDCPICDIIEAKIKGRQPHEKIDFYFNDNQLEILNKVSISMLEGLGSLVEQFGLTRQFSFKGAK
jgi:hypothetical protein